MEKVIRKHLPSLFPEEKQKRRRKKPAEPNNQFRFQFRMENSEFLSKVLNIPFELQMPATFSGQLNDSLSQMRINGSIPQFTYKGKYYESGTCCVKVVPTNCSVSYAPHLDEKGAMFNFTLITRAKNDKLHSTIYWGNNTQLTYSGKIDAIASFRQDSQKRVTPHSCGHPAQPGHSE